MTVADFGALAVMKVPQFKAARSVVELGAGDFSRSMALAERYPTKQFLSTDYQFGAAGRANLAEVERFPNLEVATLDARTVDLPARSVDFMFSVALMEHVGELAECLAAVHRVLRPGGVYFYIQAPFWTCAQGHHFRHDDDRTYEFIPKYSHLANDRDGLAQVLRDGPQPPFDIDSCVDYIYARPDLSRLGLYETKAIVEGGPLELVSWTQTPDRRYDEALATAAFAEIRTPVQFEELAVSGAEVALHRRLPIHARLARRAGKRARALRRRVRRRFAPQKASP